MAKGWMAEDVPTLPFDVDDEANRLAAACEAVKERHAGRPEALKDALVKLGLREARARGWHDTYTFTKALGEQMLVKHKSDLPAVIVRPSIIESTLVEPEPGWIDGFRMGDPLFVGYGKGYLKDFPARPDLVSDLIPCDHVVNAILATVPRCAAERRFRVYQVATGEENPAPFRVFYEAGRDYFRRNPMYERNGQPIPAPEWSFPSVASYRRKLFWKYRAPLKLALAGLRPLSFLRSVGKLRKRLAVRRASLDLLSYYVDIYSPYVNIESRYATGNTAQLWASLSPEDQRLFNFDVRGIDWPDYIGNIHIPGLKRHVLNMSEDSPLNGQPEPVALKAAPLPDDDPEHEPPLHVLPAGVDRREAGADGVPMPSANGSPTEEVVPWGRVLARTHLDDHRWLEAGLTKRLTRAVTRRLMRLYAWMWHSFEARGAEHLPDGPFVVAANHCSHLDTGAVMLACGPRAAELFVMGARDYFFNRRLRGWFFHTFLNVIPFDRTEAMIKGLRLARTVLRAGRPVLIFPEGTRSTNGELLPFKPGIGLLALELGVPIIPCHIDGTFESMPKGKVLPRRRKVCVTFAPPVRMGPYRAQHPAVDRKVLYRQVAEDVRAIIEKMQRGEG
jgi:1-acyl-sn-glycerol-3-phosphate acyltransferase